MQITSDFRIPKYCFFIISFVIIINSCENPPSDPDEISKFSILAFLTSDTIRHNIYLYKTAFLEDKDSAYFNDYFYEKATVSISNIQGESFPFYYQKGNSLIYERSHYANREGIHFKPGEKYSLKAKVEEGIIEGETSFPGDFEIISPSGADIYVDQNDYTDNGYYVVDLEIKWTKSANAFAYILNFKEPWMGPVGTYYVYNSYIAYDTAYIFTVYPFSPLHDSTRNSQVIITAVDKNFYQHHFAQYNTAGVKGGYGYLGSGTVKSVKIKFKKR